MGWCLFAACLAGYSYFTGMKASGGITEPGYNSVSECRGRCNVLPSCTGFNFLSSSYMCETFSGNDLTLEEAANAQFHSKSGCQGTCKSIDELETPYNEILVK